MQTLLITGADGFIGGKLIKKLLKIGGFKIIAITMSKTLISEMFKRENIDSYDNVVPIEIEDFFSSPISENINGVVHLAFSRHGSPNSSIADSIVFSKRLFSFLKRHNIDNLINISSQGVYGDISEFRDVSQSPSPNSLYSMAKFATEQVLATIYEDSNLNYTSLRLDNIIQSQNLVKALCKSAKEEKVRSLVGGGQLFSYLDYEDAVDAIIALLKISNIKWDRVYNVGCNQKRYTLLEIASIVGDIAEAKGFGPIDINLEKKDIPLWSGMNSSRFIDATNWSPKYDIQQMVERVFSSL